MNKIVVRTLRVQECVVSSQFDMASSPFGVMSLSTCANGYEDGISTSVDVKAVVANVPSTNVHTLRVRMAFLVVMKRINLYGSEVCRWLIRKSIQ